MSPARRAVIFLACVFATLAIDQGTKVWARSLPVRPAGCEITNLKAPCAGVPRTVIDGYWDWELAMNRGAAFSTLNGEHLLLSLAALGGLLLIIAMAARTPAEQHLKRVALALIAGGALGNLIDRLRWGAVVDFVRWHIHDHRWPIFNIADAALLIGMALLVISELRNRHRVVPLAP